MCMCMYGSCVVYACARVFACTFLCIQVYVHDCTCFVFQHGLHNTQVMRHTFSSKQEPLHGCPTSTKTGACNEKILSWAEQDTHVRVYVALVNLCVCLFACGGG